MEGSTINEKHPDDDEAAAFFGGDDDEPAAEDAPTEPTAADDAGDDDGTAAGDGITPDAAVEDTPVAATAADAAEEKARGASEREYIVFQKVALTEKVLKALLKAIEDGDSPSPRVGYFELHRATTRNDRLAIGEAYKHHRSTLGERCDLAAVSSRSFKERSVKPREVKPADDIQIV
jgi:hypothetical protein